MPLYECQGHRPEIGDGSYIAPSADIIGRVKLGKNASLWHQVVARGDLHDIIVGENTNIQDLSLLHVIEDLPCIIGKNVSVGHKVILHACEVKDSCLIGMGAILLDGSLIGENSVVAAGSVVPPGKKYPPGVMIMGSPAKVVRDLTSEELNRYGNHYQSYLVAKDCFRDVKQVFKI